MPCLSNNDPKNKSKLGKNNRDGHVASCNRLTEWGKGKSSLRSRNHSNRLPILSTNDKSYGVAHRRLTGHSHFVEDVILSSDGQSTLSGSWDSELRLSDLAAGVSTRRFVGHTKDVISVAFSLDNRQIVSASRDRTIKL
ncbi:hypothetical protein YC2023_066797 [Brassica napus]